MLQSFRNEYLEKNLQQVGILQEVFSSGKGQKIYPLFRRESDFLSYFFTAKYQYYILNLEYNIDAIITKKEFKLFDLENSKNDNGEIVIGETKYQYIPWSEPVPESLNSLNVIFDHKNSIGYLVEEDTRRMQFILIKIQNNSDYKFFAYNPRSWIIPVITNGHILGTGDIVIVERIKKKFRVENELLQIDENIVNNNLRFPFSIV